MRPERGRLSWRDRLRTIGITMVLTSAAWIIFGLVIGGGALDRFGSGLAVLKRTTPASKSGSGASNAPPTISSPAHRDVSRPLQPIRAGDYVIPVSGVRASQLTDSFNDARGGGSRLHEGIDIMAASGTPVLAAQAGTIEKLFQSDRGGNTVYIRSPDRRTTTYYAHLGSYAPGIREGQRVERGEKLGTVGHSGNAGPEAPHLHFAIFQTSPDAGWWETDNPVNPYTVLAENQR